jgi:hypothetical protein
MCYVTIGDIAKGRVLALNPRDLGPGAEIGAFAGVNPLGGDSPHYFLCVGRDGDFSFWCPLSSHRKPAGIGTADKQGQVPQASKGGFPHFMGRDTWYDTGQIWRVGNQVVIDSANTERSNRREGATLNQVASSYVDSILPGAVNH